MLGAMTKRRWMLGLVLVVAVAAVVVAGIVLFPVETPDPPARKSLNLEGFSQIRPFMTQAEVEALLGGPPGNYGRYSTGRRVMTMEAGPHPPGSVEKVWCDDKHCYEICFDPESRVVSLHQRARYQQLEPPPPPNWLKKLRSRLGL
jgi:hypothetical protein